MKIMVCLGTGFLAAITVAFHASPNDPYIQKKKTSRNLLTQKIFSEEEWARINDHLARREKPTGFDETIVKEESGTRRTPSLLVGGVHRSLKGIQRSKPVVKEENQKPDVLEPLTRSSKTLLNKEEVIRKAKEVLFENKDYSRRLLRGLKLSTVLHERNRQVEFNQSLKDKTKSREREMRLKLMEEDGKYRDELRTKRMKQKMKIDSFRRELDQQIMDKMEGRRMFDLEKAKEKTDLVKMNEELKSVAEEERLEEERKRKKLKEDIASYLSSESEIRQNLRMKEKEQEEVNKIYQVVAWELERIRKEKERDTFRKTKKLEVETVRDLKESPKKSHSGDEKLKEFLQMREARKKKLLDDLLAGKKMAEEEQEKKRIEEESERNRSVQLRCRKDEADRVRRQKEREERQRRMKNTMRHYIEQWIEKEERRRQEKEMEKFYAPDFTVENKLIGKYCDEILGLVNRYRRPLYPVVAAVKEIKKEFGLDNERNPNFLKSNVPIGK